MEDVKVFKFDEQSKSDGNTKVNHPGSMDVDVIRCSLKEGKGVKVGDRVLVMDNYPAFYRVRKITQHAISDDKTLMTATKSLGMFEYLAIHLNYEFRVIGTQLPPKTPEAVSGEFYLSHKKLGVPRFVTDRFAARALSKAFK